jgi:hypothetical protein
MNSFNVLAFKLAREAKITGDLATMAKGAKEFKGW